MKNLILTTGIALITIFLACDPYIEEGGQIGPQPTPPVFTWDYVTSDSNRIVVTDLTENVISRVWEIGENEEGAKGNPGTSSLKQDTITFSKKGTYPITLYTSIEGGGTSSTQTNIFIENNQVVSCSGNIALLTGDCAIEGKCWTFSTVSGAVTVGSGYGLNDWFTSSENGLEVDQYDDSFCFYFEGSLFQYENNGMTINPWNGYAPESYDPPPADWVFSEGTGSAGADQIILPIGQFMGVWDSGNVLDIAILTEDELVVRTPIVDQDGNAIGGWFEMYFVKN